MRISVEHARLREIQRALPKEGLFAAKEWLLSPEPFFIDALTADRLERLGHWLWKFIRAMELLYRLGKRGKKPDWILRYLENGKPAELLSLANRSPGQLPRVIRPDIILTETGWAISELDSVPGGIGLTAWLNEVYTGLGYDVLGGPTGMLDGFRSVLPSGVIAVSDESATYRPEMNWLADRLNNRFGNSSGTGNTQPRWSVVRAEDYDFRQGAAVYRFFELFDLPRLPSARSLFEAAENDNLKITPPLKPFLEEKLSFALFWSRPLQQYWRRELSDRHWRALRQFFPQTWVIDPTPVPHHAVVPGLEVQSWDEVKKFSQKQREFILKISGFSETAWGSRGVYVGPDLSQAEWARQIDHALQCFARSPFILQRFHRSKLYPQRHLNPATNEIETLRGRVRLCPYYFVSPENEIQLGGALATVVPADKKIVHGMRDAILVPAAIQAGD
jgi:hypothetical protein